MPVDMKNIIATTFVELVKQKGIDKVTVKSLIDACHISRQTFYYHFRDIMDVLEWSTQQALQDLVSLSLEKATPQEALDVLFSSILKNKAVIRKLLDSQRHKEVEDLFWTANRSFFQKILEVKGIELPINYMDLNVALDFFAFGITGVIIKNLSQERNDTQKLAEQICRILPDYLVEK